MPKYVLRQNFYVYSIPFFIQNRYSDCKYVVSTCNPAPYDNAASEHFFNNTGSKTMIDGNDDEMALKQVQILS